ncbi:Tfp pilus assembly protein FimT/FimU [Ruegeria sp. EL01]|jgi:Tfp pilus assembly protein PilV|uniref:pilus assembly FimT family protein n=1 Tax=Ruegeria sp. EL01 TaxID=2107578 RepID=UPI000EA82E96|nr:prepilin-type N-terminal cleavage/methylation domain-containing protein [Ruegeria sp. EL01]
MSSRAGYSLFEVLIAFAVMTMVLSVVLPRQAELLERSASSAKRILAADIAYSRMSELGVSRPLEFGESTERHGEWVVRQRISPHDNKFTQFALAEITISVEDNRKHVIFETNEIRWIE